MPRKRVIENPVWAVQIISGQVYVGQLERTDIEDNLTVIKWFEGENAGQKAKAYAYDFMAATNLPVHPFPM